MAISGLVLGLCGTRDERDRTARLLAADPRLQVGECLDDRLPLVASTPSSEADEALVESLRGLAGVVSVDVVFVSLEHDSSRHADLRQSETGGLPC